MCWGQRCSRLNRIRQIEFTLDETNRFACVYPPETGWPAPGNEPSYLQTVQCAQLINGLFTGEMCQTLRWGDVEQQVPGPIKVEVLIGWNRVISQPNEKSRLWCSWKFVKFFPNLSQFTSQSKNQMLTPPPSSSNQRLHCHFHVLRWEHVKRRSCSVFCWQLRIWFDGSLYYVQPFSIKGSILLTLHLFTNYQFLSLHQEISRDPSLKDHPSRYKHCGNRQPAKRPD